jgi:hypothetical protein
MVAAQFQNLITHTAVADMEPAVPIFAEHLCFLVPALRLLGCGDSPLCHLPLGFLLRDGDKTDRWAPVEIKDPMKIIFCRFFFSRIGPRAHRFRFAPPDDTFAYLVQTQSLGNILSKNVNSATRIQHHFRTRIRSISKGLSVWKPAPGAGFRTTGTQFYFYFFWLKAPTLYVTFSPVVGSNRFVPLREGWSLEIPRI